MKEEMDSMGDGIMIGGGMKNGGGMGGGMGIIN